MSIQPAWPQSKDFTYHRSGTPYGGTLPAILTGDARLTCRPNCQDYRYGNAWLLPSRKDLEAPYQVHERFRSELCRAAIVGMNKATTGLYLGRAIVDARNSWVQWSIRNDIHRGLSQGFRRIYFDNLNFSIQDNYASPDPSVPLMSDPRYWDTIALAISVAVDAVVDYGATNVEFAANVSRWHKSMPDPVRWLWDLGLRTVLMEQMDLKKTTDPVGYEIVKKNGAAWLAKGGKLLVLNYNETGTDDLAAAWDGPNTSVGILK